MWSNNDKETFKTKNEKDAVTDLHFGAGLSIRNGWDFWKKKKNSLKRYFNRKGIFHPDDISSIILTSFHRKLNKTEINLDEQVRFYKEYWENAMAKLKKENEIQEIESKNEFKSFNVGDSVKIAYILHENKSIWANRIQKYPDLNEEANCYVSGVIKGKKSKSKGKKYILTVEIIDMCGFNNAIQVGIKDDRLSLNAEYDFSLMNYKIQKN
jgi:hypothetical protein